ncbi:GyrI-like domain-containing protein [Listeria seeligeri]|uniref:GyrI-like domain-containing protein n=1 Tax=Listeria seeligeri TaxID=1640 RepID=UPI0010DFC9ED|nr:GyrI-like domain-containing protein [Listeria seeligeri]MBC1583758.1 GyrI-like domain-containing protein [Listeria seeligeri]MBC2225350.1 GyrI-like domain-containing protein [Listeria seeligeri]MBF2534078.1 GyrI-like domain-containing protein [Listeria seeligeri]MBF2541758.1 GyrI-like domain-containing protein [Listeria seeligeri]
MTRISEITMKQLPAVQMLTIRKTINFFTEYTALMESATSGILSLIRSNGTYPSTGPIVCFHNIELEALDVEIGYAVAQPIDSQGDIQSVSLPARIVAVTIDRGPYEEQDPTLESMMKWIPEHGFAAAGGIFYHYLNDENQKPSEYLTEMFMPVVKAN